MGERKGVSRRTVIGAVAGAMAAPSLAAAIWVPARRKPRSESWQSQTADGSITARYSHTATALPDGRVLVVGGYPAQASLGTGRSSALSSVEIFDPVQRNWRPVASMQSARAGHAAISLGDGRVAVLGGYAEMALATVEIYDSRSVRGRSRPRCPELGTAIRRCSSTARPSSSEAGQKLRSDRQKLSSSPRLADHQETTPWHSTIFYL